MEINDPNCLFFGKKLIVYFMCPITHFYKSRGYNIDEDEFFGANVS